MSNDRLDQALAAIVGADQRFRKDAYCFVLDAVGYTTKQLGKTGSKQARHISGQELLEGIREFALERYGPLALDLLHDWGVRRTEDIGAIVFALVNRGLLGSTEEDSEADFADGYDFREVFLQPFTAPSEPGPPPPAIG